MISGCCKLSKLCNPVCSKLYWKPSKQPYSYLQRFHVVNSGVASGKDSSNRPKKTHGLSINISLISKYCHHRALHPLEYKLGQIKSLAVPVKLNVSLRRFEHHGTTENSDSDHTNICTAENDQTEGNTSPAKSRHSLGAKDSQTKHGHSQSEEYAQTEMNQNASDNVIPITERESEMNRPIHKATDSNSRDENSVEATVSTIVTVGRGKRSSKRAKKYDIGFANDSDTGLNLDAVETIYVPEKSDSFKQPMSHTYTLASIVDHSDTLQKLLALSVNLSSLEKSSVVNEIIRMDFERDIKPHVLWLRDYGVPGSAIGGILTRCPQLLVHSVENIETRITYLKSKGFSQEDIVSLIVRDSRFLAANVKVTDRKLGFYQKIFHLKGGELRSCVMRLPKLLTWDTAKVEENWRRMGVQLGFKKSELREIFVEEPNVYLSDPHGLVKTFDYLHNKMGLSHQLLLVWPKIFRTRIHKIDARHRFLLSIGRAQYNPGKENYVPLKSLVTEHDDVWCSEVAGVSYQEFLDFQKMI